jgi:hypothetical protein
MIRILTFGGWRNRQPLAYAPLLHALGDRVELVESPAEAKLIIVSNFKDFALFGARIHAMLSKWPRLRLALLSEEPLWDSCYMPDPFTRHQRIATPLGPVACTVLNHETTQIFRAAHLPYFLLTDRRYIAHYRPRLDRNAGKSVRDWERHFAQAPLGAIFLAQYRDKPHHAPVFGGDRLRGLSVWRTEFAAACQGKTVIREGLGWKAGPARQDLPDWHADKLERFDLQTRYMSAFENTHQADYISEKIWDAFAVGAIPLYLAGPDHALHRLLGPGGWINFHRDLDAPPAFDADRPLERAVVTHYAAQQERLARLFSDNTKIEAEYDRLCETLLAELSTVATVGP